MKIQLESTTLIATVNNVKGRIWEGCTESGIPIHAIIPIIAVGKEEKHDEFECELIEIPPVEPSKELLAAYRPINRQRID